VNVQDTKKYKSSRSLSIFTGHVNHTILILKLKVFYNILQEIPIQFFTKMRPSAALAKTLILILILTANAAVARYCRLAMVSKHFLFSDQLSSLMKLLEQ
jgi:hypothetical protein